MNSYLKTENTLEMPNFAVKQGVISVMSSISRLTDWAYLVFHSMFTDTGVRNQ